MTLSNRKQGTDFERELCEILAQHGFWVHNFAQDAAGQPADIIAVRGGRAYLIDCKVCSDGKFDLRRVEENQDAAMNLWRDCGNGDGWFALLLPGDEIRMIDHGTIRYLCAENAASTLNGALIEKCSCDLDRWLEVHA